MRLLRVIGLASALAVPARAESADVACAVMPAQAAQVLGATITDVRERRNTDGGHECDYQTGIPGRSIVFVGYALPSTEAAVTRFDAEVDANKRFYVEPPVRLQNVGDEAVAFGHVVWARRRATIVVLNVIDARHRDAALREAEALARTALEKA